MGTGQQGGSGRWEGLENWVESRGARSDPESGSTPEMVGNIGEKAVLPPESRDGG